MMLIEASFRYFISLVARSDTYLPFNLAIFVLIDDDNDMTYRRSGFNYVI